MHNFFNQTGFLKIPTEFTLGVFSRSIATHDVDPSSLRTCPLCLWYGSVVEGQFTGPILSIMVLFLIFSVGIPVTATIIMANTVNR